MNRRLLLVLAVVLLLGGCANIPPESPPSVISGVRQAQPAAAPSEPASGLDALTVARDFIQASANPAGLNAAARVYLDDASRKSWKPNNRLTIVEDTFNTVYATDNEQSTDDHERVVVVRGFNVGSLGQDNAFIPATGAFAETLRVRQQAGGQWRIVDPPSNTLVITNSDFSSNYLRVAVDFPSQDFGTFVPDLRYVVAKPQVGLPGRVVDLLLQGPSDSLFGAVTNLLGDQVKPDSNVRTADDGTLLVPLTGVEEQTADKKQLIVAQVVLSLQNVTTSRIRVLSDGKPLVPGHDSWRASDLPNYLATVGPTTDLPGLMTVGGKVLSLLDRQPVPGPAGNGGYNVQSAAQSIDGRRLAVVEQADGRQRLRVGDLGHDGQAVLDGDTLTRPTWRPALTVGGVSGEVWSVINTKTVGRVVLTSDGKWNPQGVNATELTTLGSITALRLSRDGARVAAVVNRQLVVAAVVRTPDGVTLRAPRTLHAGDLTDVVDVDWAGQDTLIAATSTTTQPVVKVPIDGLRMDAFNSSNLTPPMHAVTAAPNRQVVAADAGGLWVANELGEVWRPLKTTLLNAYPFYPG